MVEVRTQQNACANVVGNPGAEAGAEGDSALDAVAAGSWKAAGPATPPMSAVERLAMQEQQKARAR